MKETKLVVTHRGALLAKYGRRGVAKVEAAVARLVEADAKRGIVSRLVALDVADDMAPFGVDPMGGSDDRVGAKRTIDAIDTALRPHYIVILGSWDVVPMQLLNNTMGSMFFAPGGDGDDQVPSDLPYACETGFSAHPEDFQGPTRVVGRLPDVPGARAPTFLVKLLDHAARAKPLPRERFEDWMGLSAAEWRGSSAKSAKRAFGRSTGLMVAPPGPRTWSRAKLAPRVHFINCHGTSLEAAFRGEVPAATRKAAKLRGVKLDPKPIAITAQALAGKVTRGTVVVSQCCYGAEAYDPKARAAKPKGQLGVALAYLGEGAAGFFGSTTTSYGKANDSQWSDVLCQHFLRRVLAGASLGRAALMARHDFVGRKGITDPGDLKTLAQFCLLGDPSIHPVARVRRRPDERPRVDLERLERERRQRSRKALRLEGREIAKAIRRFGLEKSIPDTLMNEMLAIAEDLGLREKLPRLLTLAAADAAFAGGARDPDTVFGHLQVMGLVGQLNTDDFLPTYVAIMADVVDGHVDRKKARIGFSK